MTPLPDAETGKGSASPRKHVVVGEDLIIHSGVRNIFTPHRPVQSVDLFFGRQREVKKLIEQINTPGQHGLLYGDRGVGKSSLANVAAYLLKSLMKGELFVKRCDSTDIFRTLLAKPLSEVGTKLHLRERVEKSKRAGGAKLKIPVAEAGLSVDTETTEVFSGTSDDADSPSWAAERLQRLRGLLVIDEADAIRHKDDRIKLAEFIKTLSDLDSIFKVIVVGIAETGADLVGGHRSVERCLRETKLDRMPNSELKEIITGGAQRLRLAFDPTVLRGIVNLSSGYPHFTHLLALKCAEEAISHRRGVVIGYDLERALESAAEDAENTLRQSYEKAIRPHHLRIYRYILGAAAAMGQPEFGAASLRLKIEVIYGAKVTQEEVGIGLRRLARDGAVVHRVTQGIYCFTDPRMASYVKIVERWPFMVAGQG